MTNIHDPILNPIDYKMDIRNKYIMGELIRRAEHTTETVQWFLSFQANKK